MPPRISFKTNAAPARRLAGLASALVLAGLSINLPAPCHAELIIAAPTGVTYAANGTGYFDLTIRNDGTPDTKYLVGGDVVTIDLVGGPGVRFTDATISTALPYLFQPSFDADYSLPLASMLSDTSLTISDNADNAAGDTSIAPGSSFGLGRIYFSVDPMTPATTFQISIDQADSSLSGPAPDASLVAFTTQDGTIITSGLLPAVPEPSSLMLALSGGLILVLHRLPVDATDRGPSPNTV